MIRSIDDEATTGFKREAKDVLNLLPNDWDEVAVYQDFTDDNVSYPCFAFRIGEDVFEMSDPGIGFHNWKGSLAQMLEVVYNGFK